MVGSSRIRKFAGRSNIHTSATRERILGIQAHLQVFPPPNFSRETAVIGDPGPVLTYLAANGMSGAPLIEGPILIQHRDKIIAKLVKGIDPRLERNVTAVAASMLPSSALTDKLADACVRMHTSVGLAAESFYAELRRRCACCAL